MPTMDDLQKEEERLRVAEEHDVQRKRQEAQHLAVQRGLLTDPQQLKTPPTQSSKSSPRSASPIPAVQMSTVSSTVSPLVRSPVSEHPPPLAEVLPFPVFVEDVQSMPDSSGFYVDESDYSSVVPTPQRPRSLAEEPREEVEQEEEFVPARLPHFGGGGGS